MSNEKTQEKLEPGLLVQLASRAEGLRASYFKAWEAVWPTDDKREVLGFYAAVRALVLNPKQGERLLGCYNLGEALMGAAAMGLNPAFGPLGQAVIMPAFDKRANADKAELIIGFKGYEAAWVRDGAVKPGGVFLRIVMPQDDFRDDLGMEGQIFHLRRGPEARDVTKMVCAIAVLYLRDGGVKVLRRDRDKFEKVRAWAKGRGSGGPSPYDSWPEEMALKGAIMEGKRELPIGACMMRLLEWEAQNGTDPEERDMGDVVRLDKVQPIALSAQTRVPETIPASREAMPVSAPAAESKPAMRIQDESTTPDAPTSAWTDEHEIKLSEWEGTTEAVPQAVYDELVNVVQALPRDKKRTAIGNRVVALKARLLKKDAAAAEREPGQEG